MEGPLQQGLVAVGTLVALEKRGADDLRRSFVHLRRKGLETLTERYKRICRDKLSGILCIEKCWRVTKVELASETLELYNR